MIAFVCCCVLMALLGSDRQRRVRCPGGRHLRPRRLSACRAIAELGRKVFHDPSLSASGQMACASCHDPAFGFSAPNALSVQMGGADLRQAGIRAAPRLAYGAYVPSFAEHYYESRTMATRAWTRGRPADGRGTAESTGRGTRPRCRCWTRTRWRIRIRAGGRGGGACGLCGEVRRLYGRGVHQYGAGFRRDDRSVGVLPGDSGDVQPVQQQIRCRICAARFR